VKAFQKAQTRIRVFRLAHPGVVDHPHVHAVLFDFETKTFVIHVDHEDHVEEIKELLSPPRFASKGDATPRPRVVSMARATFLGIRGGSSVDVDRIEEGRGTAGWSIILKGNPVCISAHHLFGLNVESSNRGGRASLKSRNSCVRVALLDSTPFKPWPAANSWDLAITSYTSRNDIELEMEFCKESGDKLPYPVELADDLREEAECWTVGRAGPMCSRAKVKFLGHVDVYMANVPYRFKWVMGFPGDFTQKGDSGSIVVYSSDNKVAGLVFAKVLHNPGQEPNVAYANPLFMAGWTPDGFDDKGIPKFKADSVLPPDLPDF
jgi:hypothetical protein